METFFDLILKAGLAFFGLIVGLVVLAAIFGKRIEKQWEFEAKFYDERRRELGEFDIERFRYAKQGGDFELKAKLKLRHTNLTESQMVTVQLDETLVMQGPVTQSGRIYLTQEHLVDELTDARVGQICTVKCGDEVLFQEPLYPD